MAAILLGPPGLDELGNDAEADPPDGEARETAEGVGGERRTVVGAEPFRQAILSTYPKFEKMVTKEAIEQIRNTR